VSHRAAHELDPAGVTIPAGHALARIPAIALTVGGLGIALALVLSRGDTKAFAFSWLVAFLFTLSIALGCLYFVLVHTAMQGGWGIVVRRLAENAMATIPLFALLVLPILFFREELYPWIRGIAEGKDHILHWKEPYLNTPFFVTRTSIYMVLWSAIAVYFVRASRRQDASGDPEISRKLRQWSGPAIIALGITHSFAAFDWIMSLDPHWYSTIFGVYSFAGSLLSGFSFLVLVLVLLRRYRLLDDVVGAEHYHDLGKLLFAFTVFWAYIGFSQYFLIWYGNIPEETIFFRHRLEGSWRAASFLLAAGHFVLPFFFLMPRSIKRKPGTLAAGAAWMLVMNYLDVTWLVMPSLHPHGVALGLVDVVCLVGILGLFVGVFARLTAGAPLVPIKDPRLAESLGFENI
jgi:hypothetical protein